jgi:type I restriction enzyme R subunit
MKQSMNFELIRDHNDKLANLGGLAESILHLDPGSALTRLRSFAEEITKEIYDIDGLSKLPQATFIELLKNDAFMDVTEARLRDQLHFLRIEGNNTAHGAEGTVKKSFEALATAHQLSCYMAINYYGFHVSDLSPLVMPDVPANMDYTSAQIEQLKQKSEQDQQKLIEELAFERQARASAEATVEQLRLAKSSSIESANSLKWDEETTRKMLIDRQLIKAGWDVNDPRNVGIEIKVASQPTTSGIGYVDYVLWDDDGKPLAVVEAKRAREQMQQGREQALYYAKGLAKQFNCQQPIVFYTNGYEICIWDEKQYNTYRQVYGFYTKDSLKTLHFQAQHKDPQPELLNPDLTIADRGYQLAAIKSVAKTFQEQRRKALIVQATGTGKTRVCIAITELLLKARWAKRVLFLCDRKELRRQADEAFKNFLPQEPRCVVGEKNQIDKSARIFVSTYPAMLNRFAQLDIGFFDLIIADESHRSIYNRYRDIFDYFDALQLGLTATPVKFIARNTFDLFGRENGDPTYSYDLAEAIAHQPRYLNPFKVKDFTTEFLRDGIHYNQLSPAQQQQLEDDLGQDVAKNTTIKGKDIGRKLFSESTDKIILENLVNNGIKDATGSLVGKTIIFAQNQKHAEQLERLFSQDLYPQYGTKVCKVIHNKVDRPEARIDEFKKEGSDFRIAISVDMLDTGIDVPEVVNLVFARPVKSWVKFWQMIGRGTRLCPNLFGAGKDKTEFLIFDHYGNFQYFEEEYQEAELSQSHSLLQTLFEARLALAKAAYSHSNINAFELATSLLKADVCQLPQEAISVRRQLRNVVELCETDLILELSPATLHLLESKISPLMASRTLKDKDASTFDRLIAKLQQAWVTGGSDFEDYKEELLNLVSNLAVTINEVRAKKTAIAQVQSQDYWQTVSIAVLERTRVDLRGIMKFKKPRPAGFGIAAITSAAEDRTKIETILRTVVIGDNNEAMAYRARVKQILLTMLTHNPVLQKLYQNKTITDAELHTLTSTILAQHPGVDVTVLNQFYGRTSRELMDTLRDLIGLDPNLVSQHLENFIKSHNLSYLQIQYINQLSTFISQNGRIQLQTLYEDPFARLTNGEGLDVFDSQSADQLLAVIDPFLTKAETSSM